MSESKISKLVTALLLLLTIGAIAFSAMRLRDMNENIPQKAKLNAKTKLLELPQVILPFTLTDHQGQSFTAKNFKKRWTLVFFGYIYCPDVCPNTLGTLNKVYETLGLRGLLDYTEVVFVSVDPERDSVEMLADYIPHFNKYFKGLTGDRKEIDNLAGQLGVGYNINSPKGEEPSNEYTIDHSASVFLVDPLGRLLVNFSPPHDPIAMADDLQTIRFMYSDECCIEGEEEKT